MSISSIHPSGKQPLISVSNIENPQDEQEAAAFDQNRDGFLDQFETLNLLNTRDQSKTLTLDSLRGKSDSEIYRIAGYAPQHPLEQDFWDPTRWQGDFHVDGIGHGHLSIENLPASNGRPASLSFQAQGVGMNMDALAQYEPFLVIGKQGFVPEPGSTRPEKLVFSMFNQAVDRSNPWTGVSHREAVLNATVPVDTLRNLLGSGDSLEYYIQLLSKDGHSKFINADGKPGRNFFVDSADLPM